MKKLAMFSFVCGLLAMVSGGLLALPAAAQDGDCYDDGIVNVQDVNCIIQYLFQGGTLGDPINCDVDGSPGVDLADALQLIGYLYYGCDIQPYTGDDARPTSQIRFGPAVIHFPVPPTTTTDIEIIENGGPDVMGIVIPLSFANQPAQATVDLQSVTFGPVIPPEWQTNAVIDNINKTVIIYAYAESRTDPPLATGVTGVVATLNFLQVAPGASFCVLCQDMPPPHSFMLIRWFCADLPDNPPAERILAPMEALTGDFNGDATLNLGDLVYLLNYLFRGGPPPCALP
jgi:hypothetical protein